MPPSDVSLLNYVVSDGRSLIATRYVSISEEAPASLYYAEVGGRWEGLVGRQSHTAGVVPDGMAPGRLRNKLKAGRCGGTAAWAMLLAFELRLLMHLLTCAPTATLLQGSAYERESAGEVSRKYSAAAKALHGEESMEGVAGARSRPVTGEGRAGGCRSRGGCQTWAAVACSSGVWSPPPVSPKRPSFVLRKCPFLDLSAEESDYHLLYSDKGSRVCMIASEPVTSAANDWVGGAGEGCRRAPPCFGACFH
mgnify:CR=1 FL=1